MLPLSYCGPGQVTWIFGQWGLFPMQTTQYLHLSQQLEKWCLKSCEILVYLRSDFCFFANKSTMKLDNCNQNRKNWVMFFQSTLKSSMELAISPMLARGGWAVLWLLGDREVISKMSLVCYLRVVSFNTLRGVEKHTLSLEWLQKLCRVCQLHKAPWWHLHTLLCPCRI